MNHPYINELVSAYDAKNVYTIRNDICDTPLRRKRNHEIYSETTLPKLFDTWKKRRKLISPLDHDLLEEKELNEETTTARFVVTSDNEVLFANEGKRTPIVPAHTDMSSHVYTAGNIHFSSDWTEIVKITNKSGHFKPNFQSLVFLIPFLKTVANQLIAGLDLAENLEFKNIMDNETVIFSKDDLLSIELHDAPAPAPAPARFDANGSPLKRIFSAAIEEPFTPSAKRL